jgi:phytoene/squalene synthetase
VNDLTFSRRWCAALMREHAKSFYFSTRMLPREKRYAVEALYGLCRTADDLADEPGLTRDQREWAFALMLRDLEHVRDPHYQSYAPWFAALRAAFERYPVALDDAVALVCGCRSDLEPRPIETLDELYAYSAAVAGTVGRCSMPILGAGDDDSLRRGERLGVAMQITNVLRDVEEDRQMSREYLPRRSFPGHATPQIMRELSSIARDYYSEARVLASRVPNDGSRAALLMTSDIYGGILDDLERRGFDPEQGRAHVPTREKLRRAARCLVQSYVGFASIK